MNLRPIHFLRAGSKHDKELYVLKETTDIISFYIYFSDWCLCIDIKGPY